MKILFLEKNTPRSEKIARGRSKSSRLRAIKLAFLPAFLALSSCNTPSLSHHESSLPTGKIEAATFPVAVDHQAVSTDGLGLYDTQHEALRGNGAGDLILLIAETGDKLLRKRSLLVDLSLTDNSGRLNDLTCNEILQQHSAFRFRHDELTRFIQQSRSARSLRWQVFGIMHHASGDLENNNLQLPNFGLISTVPHGKKPALDSQQLHQSRALRADLIIRNNHYGIQENQSLQSVAGEASAFDPELHSHLSNGTPSTGKLNQRLSLKAYRLQLDPKNQFSMQQQTIGSMQLHYSKNNGATLSFQP